MEDCCVVEKEESKHSSSTHQHLSSISYDEEEFQVKRIIDSDSFLELSEEVLSDTPITKVTSESGQKILSRRCLD